MAPLVKIMETIVLRGHWKLRHAPAEAPPDCSIRQYVRDQLLPSLSASHRDRMQPYRAKCIVANVVIILQTKVVIWVQHPVQQFRIADNYSDTPSDA